MFRIPHVVPKLLIAALSLAAGAAQALTWSSFPGANCTSDGAMQRPTSGSLMNITPQFSGYSTFSCPVPRNFPTSGTTPTTYVYVNFKTNNGPADFYCVLRAVDYWGDVITSDSLTVPKAINVSNIKDVWGGELQVSGASYDSGYSVILRCQVPNSPGMPAGIISYRVRH